MSSLNIGNYESSWYEYNDVMSRFSVLIEYTCEYCACHVIMYNVIMS